MWKYYIFSLSLFCRGILFFSPPPHLTSPPSLPSAYSHGSGINDKEWIRRVVGGGEEGWGVEKAGWEMDHPN